MDRPDQYTASRSDVTAGRLQANRSNDGVLLSVSYALRCRMFNVASLRVKLWLARSVSFFYIPAYKAVKSAKKNFKNRSVMRFIVYRAFCTAATLLLS